MTKSFDFGDFSQISREVETASENDVVDVKCETCGTYADFPEERICQRCLNKLAGLRPRRSTQFKRVHAH